MIRKLIKRLSLLLGLIILVPVVLVLVAAMLLPKDKIKDQVETRLAESTGAEVSLGEPSVSWWPNLAVEIDGGTISGTGADLAAATGSVNNLEDYRVQLGRFAVRVELRPLLQKQIEVGSITLSGPLLELAWDKGNLLAEDYQLEISDVILPVEAAQAQAELAQSGRALPPGDRIPADLALAFKGGVARLTVQKVPYDEVLFHGDLDARLITLEALTARRSTGLISASAEVDYERDPWGILDFEAQAEAVPAGSLLEPWVPDLAQRLTGDLGAEISGTCGLRDKDTALASLNLSGSLGCGEGELKAADWLNDVSSYLGARQDLKNIRFRSLNHDFRVDEGKYYLDTLHIDGHDTDWQGNGYVGLDGTIDAGLKVKLPAGFTPDLGKWSFLADTLRDSDGRVNLDLRLTGRSAKPKVSVDLAGLQGNTTEGATEAVKKGLGGLLDKWKTR